jgi:hypothetical protein
MVLSPFLGSAEMPSQPAQPHTLGRLTLVSVGRIRQVFRHECANPAGSIQSYGDSAVTEDVLYGAKSITLHPCICCRVGLNSLASFEHYPVSFSLFG